MPFNQRLKIFEAINGSSIHQSLSTTSSQVGAESGSSVTGFSSVVPTYVLCGFTVNLYNTSVVAYILGEIEKQIQLRKAITNKSDETDL